MLELTEEKLIEIVEGSVKTLLVDYQKKSKDEQEVIKDEVDRQLEDLKQQTITNQKTILESMHQRSDDDRKGGFKSLSQFANHVYRAGKSGFRNITPELVAWEKAAQEKAAGSPSMTEGDSEAGGYLIPDEFRQDLMIAVEQRNEILPRCMQIPMGATTVRIPYVNGFDESGGLVYGGIQWKWLDEEAQKTATKPKIGRITLTLKKIAGLAYASDELLEDSPQSMENILKNGFRDGLNFQLNNVCLRGTGAGQPLGILNAPCLVSVAKETGQAAATIQFENIVKMFARNADPGNAIWMTNQDTLPQLATMNLAIGTGGAPVWLPAGGAAERPYNTLLGRPLFFNKHCATLGTVGDIVLCDWSQYLIGQKAGQGAGGKFDTSIHIKFDYDQTCFRFVFRIDGHPWWVSALTPPQSSDTLSPFTAIATRS